MTRKVIIIVAALALFAAGVLLGMRYSGHEAVPAASGERTVLFYRNPMNPNITSPVPAKDEMGMDYIPVYEGEDAKADGGEPVVTVAPEIANNLGVRTEAATRGELTRRIESVGYVGYDEHRLSHVHLRAEGWIENLHVHAAGEQVRKGERLFQFYSPELVNAQEEFLQAKTAGDARLVELSRQRLLVLGVPRAVIDALDRGGKVQQRLPIYASQDGVIAELNVREGMYVQREMDVMTLADLSSVWVLVEVFEQQSAWVRVGQSAEVRLASLPDRVWQGLVEYIYPNVEPQTRTLRVRLRFTNPGTELKPNMYAQATIHADPRQALSIPREALIRTEHGAHVILARGEGRFSPAPVKPGIESGDRVEIVEGLSESEKVVVSAQFLIDSEASLRAALRRMTQPADEPASEQVAIEAHGVINTVDASGRKLNLAHDPIPSLGWPAMTMDFTVNDGVSLEGLIKGERIRFSLQQRNGEYRISALEAADADRIRGRGTLKAADAKARKVNIDHEPIPALGWPSMVMDFAVAEDVPLNALQPGAKVEFELRRIDPVTYEITALRAAGGGGQ